MSEEIKTKERLFNIILHHAKKIIIKNEPIKQNLKFNVFLNSFLIIIPVHGILYLKNYYENFNTQYFLYFNPIDFINVFYDNNSIFLIYIIFFAFIGLYFVINFIVVAKLNIETNKLLIITYLLLVLLLIILKVHDNSIPFQLFFFMSLVVFVVLIKSKQVCLTYFTLTILYFFYTLNLAKTDALKIKENKPNFNIILNDNTYALKKDTINHKDYFIGKVTDYVLIYNDSLKKVRVIPVKEIKEIQF